MCSSEPSKKKVFHAVYTKRIPQKKFHCFYPALFKIVFFFIMSENEKRRNSPLRRARSKLRWSVKATCCSPRSFLSFSEYPFLPPFLPPPPALAMTSRLLIPLGRLVRTFLFFFFLLFIRLRENYIQPNFDGRPRASYKFITTTPRSRVLSTLV